MGVSRNKQHSTTEQPGSDFISIPCHFTATKFINFISTAGYSAIDSPCGGLGNDLGAQYAEMTKPAITSIQMIIFCGGLSVTLQIDWANSV